MYGVHLARVLSTTALSTGLLITAGMNLQQLEGMIRKSSLEHLRSLNEAKSFLFYDNSPTCITTMAKKREL